MDILTEVKKWLPSNEEIKNYILFGRKTKPEILGETARRTFYYKTKGKYGLHGVCPGTFALVVYKKHRVVIYIASERFKIKIKEKKDLQRIQEFFHRLFT
jgi:hypothetical protein